MVGANVEIKTPFSLRLLSEERFRKAPFSLRLIWMVGPTVEIKSFVFSPLALWRTFSKSSVFVTVSLDGSPTVEIKSSVFSPFSLCRAFSKSSVFVTVSSWMVGLTVEIKPEWAVAGRRHWLPWQPLLSQWLTMPDVVKVTDQVTWWVLGCSETNFGLFLFRIPAVFS